MPRVEPRPWHGLAVLKLGSPFFRSVAPRNLLDVANWGRRDSLWGRAVHLPPAQPRLQAAWGQLTEARDVLGSSGRLENVSGTVVFGAGSVWPSGLPVRWCGSRMAAPGVGSVGGQ